MGIRTRPNLAILAAAGALVAGSLLHWGVSPDLGGAASESTIHRDRESDGTSGESGFGGSSQREDGAGARVALSGAERSSLEEGPSPRDQEGLTFRGRAVRVDEFGVEHSKDDGLFQLWTGTEDIQVEVKSGEWSAELSCPEYAAPSALVLAGKTLALEETSDARSFEVGEEQLIVGREIFDVRLFVRAATSGVDLSGLDLVLGKDPDWDLIDEVYLAPRSPTEFLARGAASPLSISPSPEVGRGGYQLYWVRAPGFAWRSIDLDHTSSGDREVRLVPAGSLRVQVRGSLLGTFFKVLVFDGPGPEADPIAWAPVIVQGNHDTLEHTVEFQDLPAGVLRVEVVEVGYHYVPRGQARVELAAGALTTVEISVLQATSRWGVLVAGTLALSNYGDKLEEPLLLLCFRPAPRHGPRTYEQQVPVSRMRSMGNGTYAFECELGAAGYWDIGMRELSWWIRVEVHDDGLSDLELVLPELSRVEVELVDATDGRFLSGELFFSTALKVLGGPAEPTSMEIATEISGRPGVYSILTIESELRLWPWVEGYSTAPMTRQVSRGDAHLRLELLRSCGFEVALLDGDARVPSGPRTHYSVTTREGESVLLYQPYHGRLELSCGPGSYLLSITDLEGFEDVRDLEVTVLRREMAPLDVPLTRSW